jgi:hypothetical protein
MWRSGGRAGNRIHGLLPSTLPLDADRPQSLGDSASASLVLPGGVWQRGRFRTVVCFLARLQCGLHTWKSVRGIRILHNAYQLSAVGDRTTAPATLAWNTPASRVASQAEIIGVERDDGDRGFPSEPVGHRSAQHVPPPSPSAGPQQNEVSVLFHGNPDDFINRSAHGHHREYVGLTFWRNQGLELPMRFLTEVVANELLIKRRPEVISARIDHVPEG